MKRLISSLLLFILIATALHASRALSIPVTVTQPDGTSLTIILQGDKDFAWTETADGIIVTDCGEQGYRVAAIDAGGRLTTSTLLAHNADRRTADEQRLCREQMQHRTAFLNRGDGIRQARRAQVTSASYFQHKGSPRCLVILVNFSDNAFTSDDPKAQFEQYFNGETQENLGHNEQKNIVSVRKYFSQSSQGQFTPQFDIVGPYTLPQTMSYYGRNTSGEASDDNYAQFCKDAIALAQADETVDLHNYDNDDNSIIELVCVVYAGVGESVSGNPANTIWPKCGYRGISIGDGLRVNYMNCSPELYRTGVTDINGIGLFCHEFSHGMGLPDLYPTNTDARMDNQTPEFWDLMDYGEYGGNGYRPVPYTAWEQEAMGWIEIEQLTQTANGIQMTPTVEGGKAYKFGNGTNDEEYIIIQNIQQYNSSTHTTGSAYGHGLVAMHVAYPYHTVNMNDNPNNTPQKPRVSIVPADALVINGYRFVTSGQPTTNKPYTQQQYVASLRGDAFPGTENVTELTADMQLPNYTFYNGEATPAFKLQNISEDEGVVTFDFTAPTATAITTVEKPAQTDDYYTLDGRRLDGKPLRSGAYIRNHRLMIQK